MPSTAFAARLLYCSCAAWTCPFTLSRIASGLRCSPSSLDISPADFLANWDRDYHTIEVFPSLGSSASPVSRRGLKVFSSRLGQFHANCWWELRSTDGFYCTGPTKT